MDGYANRITPTLLLNDEYFGDEIGKVAGFSILRSINGTSMCHFSLHAGVMARADERQKLERLCR